VRSLAALAAEVVHAAAERESSGSLERALLDAAFWFASAANGEDRAADLRRGVDCLTRAANIERAKREGVSL
jgi:hypothetical protein